MTTCHASVLGTAMSDMGRRDLAPEQLGALVVRGALADAGMSPDDLELVVVANALGGRLCDQGCIRAEAWLRDAGLGAVGMVNVDNSCAGGSSALHLGVKAALGSDRPVLVAGIEKMWTGDRDATLAGIEDGLPASYRGRLHHQMAADHNPAGSILMGLNAAWAAQYLDERGGTVEQFAAAAVKARLHASRNPLAQFRQAVTSQDVLESAPVAGVLTRLMCSSFTDGAAAVVVAGADVQAPVGTPRIIGSVARSGDGRLDYHERLAQAAAAAWDASGAGPEDVDLVELHDATSAEELYALESLGFFDPGQAGPATLAGDTTVGGQAVAVNPSGGLVGRGHPLGATGIAQVVEVADQLRRRAGDRQVDGARLGVAVNTGGVIEGDAAFVGVHVIASGSWRPGRSSGR